MCAQTRTDWVLVDVAAKRPTRVPDWMVERFTPKGLRRRLPSFARPD
jgi:acyl-CoA thioester hydrolase